MDGASIEVSYLHSCIHRFKFDLARSALKAFAVVLCMQGASIWTGCSRSSSFLVSASSNSVAHAWRRSLLSTPTVNGAFVAGDVLSLQQLAPAKYSTYEVITNVSACPSSVPQYYSAVPSQDSSLDPRSSSSPVDDESQVPPSLFGPVIPSFRISRRYSLAGVSNPQTVPSPPQSGPGVELKPIAGGDFVRTSGNPFS